MPKKNIARIIFIFLTVLLIISLILLIKGEKKDRTKNIYRKICESTNYTFSLEEGIGSNNKLIIARSGNNKGIDLTSEGNHTTTFVKDGFVYSVLHNQKEYSVFENEENQQIEFNILEEDSDYIMCSPYINGKEKIYGKTYYYEEYKEMDSFYMRGLPLEEDSSPNTRFYYNGEKLEYIKTIIHCDDSEEISELLKVDFTPESDERIFEIPNDYAEL